MVRCPVFLCSYPGSKLSVPFRNALLGAVRTKNSLADDIREICICRVALINSAWFEWNAHYPILLKAEGFTDEMGKVVKELHPTSQGALSAKQWAVLQYADAMTRHVSVPEAVFDAVKSQGFNEQEIVEITTTTAAYNMVSRFLVALNVGEQNDKVPEMSSKVTNP
jgi:alkylhydroperoxidase family enzyme